MKQHWRVWCALAGLAWVVGCGGGSSSSSGSGSTSGTTGPTASSFRAMTPDTTTTSTTGAVSGTVVDSNGQPVAGATVTVSGTASSRQAGTYSFSTVTDGSGHYAIGNVPPGTYTMTMDHPALGKGSAQVLIAAGQVLDRIGQKIQDRLDGQPEMGGGHEGQGQFGGGTPTTDPGVLLGQVTDQSTSKPIAGAHLILNNSMHAATGPNGYFAFPPLSAGSYDVACSAPGFDPVVQTAAVVAGQSTTLNFALTPGTSTTTTTQTPGTVSGVVTDGSTTSPVANATVTLSQGRATATTDAQGHFSFTAVTPGGYLLQVTATGYVNYRQPVPVTTGATLTVNVTLVPKPTSTTQTGTLTVTVTDQSTSQPLKTAACRIDDQGPFFVDPASGIVTINNVPVGKHVVMVGAPQYRGTVLVVTITASQTTSQSVALTPHASSSETGSDTNITSNQRPSGN